MSLIVSGLLKSSFANGMSLVVRISEQLILVPVFLMIWSMQMYGEWLMISALPTFLALSDMGFITAGSNELARRSSYCNQKEVRQYYGQYIALCSVWGIGFIAVLCLIVCILPFSTLFNLQIFTESEAKWVFILLSLSALINQNSLALLAGLRIKQRYHQGLWIRAVNALVRMLLVLLALYVFKLGAIGISIIILLCSISAFFVEWILVLKLGLKPIWNSLFNGNQVSRSEVIMGLEYMLLPLAQMIVLQGSVILIGVFFGGALVAVFSTHRTLSRLVSSILQIVTNPLTAEVGLLQKQEDKIILKETIVIVSRITIWVSSIVIISLMILGNWIFSTWTHGKITFEPILFLILLLTTLFETVWRTLSTVRLGTNMHRPLVRGYLVLSIFGMFLSYISANFFDLKFVAISYMFVDILMCFIVAIFTLPLLGISNLEYIYSLFKPPIREIKYLFQKIKLKV